MKTFSGRRAFARSCFMACCLGAPLAAQTFEPFPNGSAVRYQFDLARNFYASDSAALRDQQQLTARLRQLEDVVREAPRSPSALLVALATQDTLARLLARQQAYLTLRTNLATNDTDSRQRMSELFQAATPSFGDLDRYLGRLTASQVESLTRTEPRLARYRYSIELSRRAASHRRSDAAEAALGAAEAESTSWGPVMFRRLMAATRTGSVRAPEGVLDLGTQGNQARNHVNRQVRADAFLVNNAIIATRRDSFAFILSREAMARNSVAHQRGWPDYPTQFYDALGLTPKEVRGILTAIAARADVNKRYERSRIAELKRSFGYDTVHVWDLTAPEPGRSAPRYTIQQASAQVLDATAPFGASYAREMRALLDPANGRLDMVPRANRVDRPGFSTGLVGYPSMFFQGRYEGYLDDLVILAHEAGHGVQNMLMDSAGVLPRYAGGPSYFTESFATLNELLLLEHLATSSADSADRRYFRRQLLENALGLFRNAHESLLELQIYDSAAAGRALGADDIEALTQRTGAEFSIWFGPGSERRLQWVQPIQFYTWPLYRVNYVLARLLALGYLDQMHRDPAGFQTRYLQLLRNGYDAPPDVLLKRIMGIDLRDESLVNGAVDVIAGWMNE
jgi:oligoendopeptidase F